MTQILDFDTVVHNMLSDIPYWALVLPQAHVLLLLLLRCHKGRY